MGTHASLDELRSSGSILAGIRIADELTVAASRDGGARAVRLLAEAALDGADQVAAIAATHALGQVFDEAADGVLVSLLRHESPFLREHAAWAFSGRLPRLDAFSSLISMVIEGGFSGMIAQRTLEQWSGLAADQLAVALEGALLGVREPDARGRLVETLGLVPGRIPDRFLRDIATDAAEPAEVRGTAIAAMGDRSGDAHAIDILTSLASEPHEFAAIAKLALYDLASVHAGSGEGRAAHRGDGLTIAQLFLHADIDRDLTRVGSGDNGGIATLLVRVGDALIGDRPAGGDRIDRVITMSRGSHSQARDCLREIESSRRGHSYAAIPAWGGPVSMSDAWTRRIQVQRGIRRILRAAGRVDAIHLRMADVGTLAASTVARELDIPVVFTVAPDPHTSIQALDDAGALTREGFGATDADEHYWFRVRLIQRIASDAAHTVLFPRHDLEKVMHDLVGIDVTSHPERHSVIAEGIDLRVIERSRVHALAASVDETHLDEGGHLAFSKLDELLADLPESRRGLPLAITVGRLHRVKGMAALVETWSADPHLRDRCNLLVVGGELDNPSSEEREQLDRIDAAVPRDGAGRAGLLLAGHQTNDTVGRWLAAARYGRPGLAAAHGIYVCASIKEEFGIAILEAMATGLAVVAPASGGPATYVEHGVTGHLVDTSDRAALASAIVSTLELAAGPSGFVNAERASAMVESTFAIETMATSLASVYRDVSGALEHLDWAFSK